MKTTLYTFMLDLFPLTDEILQQSPVLGSTMQSIALEALLLPKQRNRGLKKLAILLQLAADLGYVSYNVIEFLKTELTEISRGAHDPQQA